MKISFKDVIAFPIKGISYVKNKIVTYRETRKSKRKSASKGKGSKFLKIGITVFLITALGFAAVKIIQHGIISECLPNFQQPGNDFLYTELKQPKKSVVFYKDFFEKEGYESRFPSEKVSDLKRIIEIENTKIRKVPEPQSKHWDELSFFEKLGRIAVSVGTEHPI